MTEKIVLDNGKYTIINNLNNGGRLHALRHGEEWRDLSGDGLVLAMYHEIEQLREAISWGVSCGECSNQLAEEWQIVRGRFLCDECAEGGAE